MRFDKRSILASILLALSVCPSNAQTVTNHAFALGKGPGVTGYTSLLCTSAQLAVGQAAADPICRTVTGDVTIDATGATAIGASKVANAQLATMLANTTKCNATGGTTNPTDCSAATMRTNLALVPGTNVEAWDADLDALAALAGTGIARRTGSNTWSVGTAVTNAELATMVTNTLKGNATSGAAVPTDLAMPSCSSASSALTWTTNTGFGCNSIVGGGGVTSVNGLTGAVLAVMPVSGGRLAVSVGVPSPGVCNPTSDILAATVVYLAPCNGQYVQIYNGTNIQAYNYTAGPTDTVGLTLTLGSNWAANTLFDVFVTLNGGVPVLCTVPWSSFGAGTSARAIALGQYSFQTNATIAATCRISNAATISVAANQGTYLGTFMTNASTGQIDLKFGSDAAGGGAAFASVWNAYNQILGSFVVRDTRVSWSPSTTTFEPLDATGTGAGLNNRITIVQGQQTNIVDASIVGSGTPWPGFNGSISIGLNTQTGLWSKCGTAYFGPAASQPTIPLTTSCAGYVPVGYNFLQGMEIYGNVGAVFYGGQGWQTEALVAKWLW